MAFGDPTRYIPLDANKVEGGVIEFDKAVLEASEVYKGKFFFGTYLTMQWYSLCKHTLIYLQDECTSY